MAVTRKDYGSNLIQSNPTREALLEKMRDKLARNVPMAKVREVQKKDVRKKTAGKWSLRIVVCLLVVAVNFLYFGKKETILAHLGYQSVPSLPRPNSSLTIDEQALYWTYALYDIQKLRSHFDISGYYAINQVGAKRNLEDLLPKVSTSVLGEISTYAPVAFRSIGGGGLEK